VEKTYLSYKVRPKGSLNSLVRVVVIYNVPVPSNNIRNKNLKINKYTHTHTHIYIQLNTLYTPDIEELQ